MSAQIAADPCQRRRDDALAIFRAAVDAVDPDRLVRETVLIDRDSITIAETSFDLTRYDRIVILGGGKASARRVKGLEELLAGRSRKGIIVTGYGSGVPLEDVRVIEAGHPVPDENGQIGTRELLSLAASACRNTLVFCVISGGSSALLTAPVEGVSQQDMRALTRLLLASGAAIDEINTVRKHLSRIKGGNLATLVYPATLVTLIISDVIGNPLDVIASGPTVADPSTFADAVRVLEKHDLVTETPPAVFDHLTRGVDGSVPETPKPGDPRFVNVFHSIIGDNRKALKRAERAATRLGYDTVLLPSSIQGETRDAATSHARIIERIAHNDDPVVKPACLLSGGECTVRVTGDGKGGRNQEFALAAAIALEGVGGYCLLSAGTDGIDGPTDAAGAIVDPGTLRRAGRAGLDAFAYLENNDSYNFFRQTGDRLFTGATGTNVMDVQVVLVGDQEQKRYLRG